MKKDKFNSKYWDRKGRQVNKRGYLIDMDGNVVNTKNNKLFDVKGLLKDGEIPKIFSFTKFNQKEVTGQFEVDPLGLPVLTASKNQKGVLFDDNGKQVNKMGFLTNDEGDIVNQKGKRVFRRAILEDGFVNIPEVFRAGRGLVRTDSQDSFQKALDEVENIAGDQPSMYENEYAAVKGTATDNGRDSILTQNQENQAQPFHNNQGDTSMEDEMGHSPSQYDEENQRYEPLMDAAKLDFETNKSGPGSDGEDLTSRGGDQSPTKGNDRPGFNHQRKRVKV